VQPPLPPVVSPARHDLASGEEEAMANRRRITVDGNEAAASVAYRASEAVAIYPITPSSPMAELCDEWASRRRLNLWGAVPEVAELARRDAGKHEPRTAS